MEFLNCAVIEDVEVTCPYCGEPFGAQVDCSTVTQDYFEDCPVCCQPIEFHAACADGRLFELTLRRDNE